jgi:hypothetical protein
VHLRTNDRLNIPERYPEFQRAMKRFYQCSFLDHRSESRRQLQHHQLHSEKLLDFALINREASEP